MSVVDERAEARAALREAFAREQDAIAAAVEHLLDDDFRAYDAAVGMAVQDVAHAVTRLREAYLADNAAAIARRIGMAPSAI